MIKAIQIGPIKYDVVESHDLFDRTDQVLGECDPGSGRINVRPGLKPDIFRATLMHEVVHAALFNGGIMEHDEQIVEVLSNGLCDVLLRNTMFLRMFENG